MGANDKLAATLHPYYTGTCRAHTTTVRNQVKKKDRTPPPEINGGEEFVTMNEFLSNIKEIARHTAELEMGQEGIKESLEAAHQNGEYLRDLIRETQLTAEGNVRQALALAMIQNGWVSSNLILEDLPKIADAVLGIDRGETDAMTPDEQAIDVILESARYARREGQISTDDIAEAVSALNMLSGQTDQAFMSKLGPDNIPFGARLMLGHLAALLKVGEDIPETSTVTQADVDAAYPEGYGPKTPKDPRYDDAPSRFGAARPVKDNPQA